MPWNEADRAKDEVIRARCSSDMPEAELALIAPQPPPPLKRRGRKPRDARIILNALFYLIRCGCPWRDSPKDFPLFTTVQNRFHTWRDSGLRAQIIRVLAMDAREAEGRQAAPTAVVVDSFGASAACGRFEGRQPKPRNVSTKVRQPDSEFKL